MDALKKKRERLISIGRDEKEREEEMVDAEKNHARGVYAKRENGRVNQEIARHTQNSTARWNLNSVSGGVEFASVCLLRLSSSLRDVFLAAVRSYLAPPPSRPASSHGISARLSLFRLGELARLILSLS